jgi:thiol:disulfide interchange protein DsbC
MAALAGLFSLAALALAPAHAQDAAKPEAAAKAGTKIGGPEANIRRAMESKMRPGTKIDGVEKSPYFGLYEVRIGSDLLYTDEKMTFIIAGTVFDGKTMANLSEERINKLTAVKFEELPLKDSIKMVNGTGKRQVAYFADPNCGYCKQFERSLTQVKDATVYVFLYPILSEDSVVKSKLLWCAPDRVKAWNDWMLRGQISPGQATCDTTAIDNNGALGKRLNVRATPTIVLGNGQKIPGAIPVAQLEKALAEAGNK